MYLLIAYKPNSVEYSQGRRVISYDSSFVSINRLTGNLLIKYWSDILLQNKSLDYGEDSYKVQIYKDGNLNWDEVESAGATWDGDDGDRDIAVAQIMNIHHEAEKEANKRHQEEKWIETAIKVRKEKEERAKTQEQRRQQYEALKQEFEKE